MTASWDTHPTPTEPIDADQSLSELLSRMTNDVGKLVGTQLELAKVEIKDEMARVGRGAGMVGGGSVAAWFAVLLLSFALAHALGDLFDNLPAAFLIVGVVYAIAAAVLLLKGKEQIASATPIAQQTKATLKEDLEWARQQKT